MSDLSDVIPMSRDKAEPAHTEHGFKTLEQLKVDQTAENLKSYIAEGDVVNGDLEVAGGARIAGHVKGSVICNDGSAIVEETGVVDHKCTATMRVIVAGKVGGADNEAHESGVECQGQVIAIGKGVIEGNVTYGLIANYDDSYIAGSLIPWARRKQAA